MQRSSRRLAIAMTLALVATTGPAAQPTWAADPPADPIGHWAFDEPSGASAADSSPNANHGTISGASRTAGRIGSGALTFDGSGDAVTVPDSTTLEPTLNFSIAFWIKSATVPANGVTIVAKGADACGDSSWAITGAADGRLRVRFEGSSGAVELVSGQMAIWDDTWHHVALTRSTAVRFHVDGHPQLEQITASGTLLYGTADDQLLIGGNHAACGSAPGFVGSLDDVRVYGRSIVTAGGFVDPETTTVTMSLSARGVRYCQDKPWLHLDVSPVVTYRTVLVDFIRIGGWSEWGGEYQVGSDGHLDLAPCPEPGYLEVRVTVLASGPASQVVAQHQFVMVGPRPTTLIGSLDGPVTAGTGFPLRINTGGYNISGTVSVYEIVDGADVFIGDDTFDAASYAVFVPGRSVGLHQFRIVFPGTPVWRAAEDILEVNVLPRAADLTLAIEPLPAMQGKLTSFRVSSPDALIDGKVTIFELFGLKRRAIGTVEISNGQASVHALELNPGKHTYVARLGAGVFWNDEVSNEVTIEVLPDLVVETVNHNVGPGTFYPFPDDYQDELTISGVVYEPATITARVYAGATLVRSLNLGQLDYGPYSGVWDGRNAAGAIVPGGTYKVSQVITDRFGNTKTVDANVVVSPKKLVSVTASTTLNGEAVTAFGQGGTGKTLASAYADGMKVTSGTGGFVRLGYQVSLPVAFRYTALSFSVLGSGGVPPGTIAVTNWSLCGSWEDACFDGGRSTPTTYGWSTTSVDPETHISGGTVRGAVMVTTPTAGVAETVDVRDVKFTYTYAVLQ